MAVARRGQSPLLAWCGLPAGYVALTLLLLLGASVGAVQVAVGCVMLILAPLVKRCFLAVIRQLYPTRAGRVHVWFMLFVRRHWMQDRKHAVPVRVDVGKSGEANCSVHVVAGLLDNYSYVIVDRTSQPHLPLRCCVVDPGDADAVLEALQELREQQYASPNTKADDVVGPLVVEAILVTHKHWDHQAGTRKVLEAEKKRTATAALRFNTAALNVDEDASLLTSTEWSPKIRVVAGEFEASVDCLTHAMKHGQIFKMGNSLKFQIVESPCHTRGHVMFALLKQPWAENSEEGPLPKVFDGVEALFTGDTLFCGGCGAPFEGDAQDMARNFRRIYHRCDAQTLLFPGHEYSETLLSECFGGSQPTPWAPRQYAALAHALLKAHDARAHERPSVPVKLGQEISYNQHFQSLHAASSSIADSWRLFCRVVHAADAHRDDSAFEAENTDRSLELLRQLRRNSPVGQGGAPAAAENGDVARVNGPRGVHLEIHHLEIERSKVEPEEGVVQHRVQMQGRWRAGQTVNVQCSGVEFELQVPEGVAKGGSFVARMPKDRLPPVLVYEPADYDDPLATVWRRDLERLRALLRVGDSARAASLAEFLLGAPLADGDEDSPAAHGLVAGRHRRRSSSKLPRAHYRGAVDEDAAHLRVIQRREPACGAWKIAPAPGSREEAWSLEKPSVCEAFSRLSAAAFASQDAAHWKSMLCDASALRSALKALSHSADADDDDGVPVPRPGAADFLPDGAGDLEMVAVDCGCGPTVTVYELREALTQLGAKPLTHDEFDDLLAVAERAGCVVTADGAESHRSEAPVLLAIDKLSHVLGAFRERDTEFVRTCLCCAVKRRKPRSAAK
ncbi:beta-lactamase-like protein [Pelagophyceae sp. CCMP2097]|nr:beta-lactamase-like protein [Pelagophyceae sp. CCMP2097]